jgi:hypothetical protein
MQQWASVEAMEGDVGRMAIVGPSLNSIRPFQ